MLMDRLRESWYNLKFSRSGLRNLGIFFGGTTLGHLIRLKFIMTGKCLELNIREQSDPIVGLMDLECKGNKMRSRTDQSPSCGLRILAFGSELISL